MHMFLRPDMGKVSKIRISWIPVLCLLIEGLHLSDVTVQFASIGENIQLTCPAKNVNSWQKIETNTILASCELGTAKISNISNKTYITDNCDNLTINNITKIDIGTYRCYVFTGTKSQTYDFNIKIRTLNILEANGSSIIVRTEGENVTLTCCSNVVNSNALLYWKTEGHILVSNRSNYVIYSFVTQQSNNMKQFVCTSNSSHSLEAKVQLKLILRPRVSLISSPSSPKVKKGHTIVLRCQEDSGSNGSIESFIWSHDGLPLSNNINTLQFESVKIEDAGNYRCTATNRAGNDSAYTTVVVTFPPVIRNFTVVFETCDRPRTLECNVSGVPDTYTYSKWLHYNYDNQLIRCLDGQTNGTLILPNDDADDLLYEDSGKYICNVTNSIKDDEGQLWQTGKINVIVKGIPVLVKPRKYCYFGNFNETSSVNVSVLSFSNKLNAEWFDLSGTLLATKSCTPSATETEQFGQLLNVTAYKCSYVIPNTKIDDFKTYTVRIANEYGKGTFNISLMSAREPKKPKNIQLHSSSNHIYVEFEPGFNGGYPQTFIIEYRKASAGHWTRCEVANSETHYKIENLEYGTEYNLRMYSLNKLGNSTLADGYSIQTIDKTNSSGNKYIGFTLGCVLLVCIVLTLWRFRKAKKNEFQRSIANEQQIQGGGLIINIPHGSAVDLNISSSASAGRGEIYSSIDRRKHNLYNQKITYQNSREEKRKKSKLTDGTERKGNSERGSSLHYIDIVFEPKPHIERFYIHGADNRTPYADIDLSLTAEPLVSSDEESVSSPEDQKDIVSFEDAHQ